MAHKITSTDGIVLAGKKAWHGLGTVLPEGTRIDPDLALDAAGLRWTVEQCPLSTVIEGDPGEMERLPITSHVANVRSDTREILGVVGQRYVPLQNHELAEFVTACAGEYSDLIEIESAGSLKGGKRVWFLARTRSMIELGDDKTVPYIMFSNGHDGMSAVWVAPTAIRVVCNNTMTAAVWDARKREAKGKAIRFRHDGNMRDNVEAARLTIERAVKGIDVLNTKAHELANTSMMTDGDTLAWFTKVYEKAIGKIPTAVDADDKKAIRARRRAEKTVSQWFANYNDPKENALGTGGSAWMAYNAVSRWVDHGRKDRGEDNRINSNLFGTGVALKSQAFDAAMELAEAK